MMFFSRRLSSLSSPSCSHDPMLFLVVTGAMKNNYIFFSVQIIILLRQLSRTEPSSQILGVNRIRDWKLVYCSLCGFSVD